MIEKPSGQTRLSGIIGFSHVSEIQHMSMSLSDPHTSGEGIGFTTRDLAFNTRQRGIIRGKFKPVLSICTNFTTRSR
jgi:hypothetical protein